MLDVAMMHERTRAKSEEFAVGGGDKPGVMPDASSEDAESQPVFQSRLRAKKEERMLQRQLEQELSRSPGAAASHGSEINTKVAVRGGHESISPGKDIGSSVHGNSHRPIAAEAGEDAIKRRERAEARKRVIEYRGTVWDAVSNNELGMVQNYFLVEGAQMLLRQRHPDAEQGGRSLLHCAAWLGYKAIVELILTTGCDVDVVDSVASMTTALSEAARAGHADVCVSLLRHGANPRRCDSHGVKAMALCCCKWLSNKNDYSLDLHPRSGS
ncbi:Ankyrin repeat domain-containing protein 39 [Phytophthora ramorum]|uniref:Ankyrin repeat domain-containing protein 39 n=1 Tax=Phytophthora ramorum TaxID=164328 RepID=UPI003099DFAF|nr:Ankyrin repeat domain-containing protein 39 [Phytophthora ramorum]